MMKHPPKSPPDSADEIRQLRIRIEELERELAFQKAHTGEVEAHDGTLFENTGTATVIIEADTTIRLANDTFCQLVGLPREEIEGKVTWTRFVDPDDLKRMREYHEKRRISGKSAPRHYEFRLISAKGSIHEIYLTVDVIPSTKLSIASLSDITPLKEAQRTIQKNEDRLKTILQEMPVMLGARDHNNLICAWNKECERVTGWTAEEVIGNPKVDNLFYPDSDYHEKMKKELQGKVGDYRNWEWETACKDGSVKRISWSNISRYSPVQGWSSWGIGIDITALHEAEERLRTTEKLRVAQQLAGTIAHEFRQPLAALKIAADLIELNNANPKQTRLLTKKIHKSVERIDKLVAGLLSITQLEPRSYALNLDILDLDKSTKPQRPLD
ncbi:MAG: PAS domain S-box protein [bacterium]